MEHHFLWVDRCCLYVIIGVIGIISGILCAQADVPLAWSGRKEDSPDSSKSEAF